MGVRFNPKSQVMSTRKLLSSLSKTIDLESCKKPNQSSYGISKTQNFDEKRLGDGKMKAAVLPTCVCRAGTHSDVASR